MKTDETYKAIMEDISDILEGGDVALDFEDSPHCQSVIRIIMLIASNELLQMKAIEETIELFKELNKPDDTPMEASK
jgi:hypothetical protein